MKSLKELTYEEAQILLKKYLAESSMAIDWLKEQFEQTGGGKSSELDFSKPSLVKLWHWFVPQIRMRPYSEVEMEEVLSFHRGTFDKFVRERISAYPEAEQQRLRQDFLNSVLKDYESGELTNKTLQFVSALAHYFAAVFLKELPGVFWGVCHQKTVDYNHAVLFGFQPAPLNPLRVVYNVTRQALENSSECRLLEVFEIWAKKFNPQFIRRQRKNER